MSLFPRLMLAVCLSSMASLGDPVPGSCAARQAGQSSRDARARDQVLSLSCSGCHGPEGRSSGIIPSFYGKSPDYIESALRDFKTGARTSTVMGRHAKGYSDEEIHQIAEYFGSVWKHRTYQEGRR